MATDERTSWLASLKPGDEVAVTGCWGLPYITHIARETKTRLVVQVGNGDAPFSKDYGSEIGGGSFHARQIIPVTQQVRDTVERAELEGVIRRKFKNDTSGVPLATLREVVRLLKGTAELPVPTATEVEATVEEQGND